MRTKQTVKFTVLDTRPDNLPAHFIAGSFEGEWDVEDNNIMIFKTKYSETSSIVETWFVGKEFVKVIEESVKEIKCDHRLNVKCMSCTISICTFFSDVINNIEKCNDNCAGFIKEDLGE